MRAILRTKDGATMEVGVEESRVELGNHISVPIGVSNAVGGYPDGVPMEPTTHRTYRMVRVECVAHYEEV